MKAFAVLHCIVLCCAGHRQSWVGSAQEPVVVDDPKLADVMQQVRHAVAVLWLYNRRAGIGGTVQAGAAGGDPVAEVLQ